MAHYNHTEVESLKAASVIAGFVPVMFLPGGSALDETVHRAGSINDVALGMTIATVATPGDPVAVVTAGRAKGIAGASLGAGAFLGVGSTNGILIPLSPSAAAAPTLARYIVGQSLVNAVAGDVFTVKVKPEQFI